MNKITVLLFLLPSLAFSQGSTCCSKSSAQEFNRLAMSSGFSEKHESPLPPGSVFLEGEMIRFLCPDSTSASAFEIRATSFTTNWLILVHEWWGLNDYIKLEAEKLQTALGKVNVLAIDLYDGKVAETAPVAQQLLGSLSEERARNIIQGAIQYTGVNSRIMTLGWCMGGGWALQTSLLAGNKSTACVMYYGMPETDVSKLKTLSADVLAIFASKDEWINEKVRKKFETDMKQAGKQLVTRTYEADHAFANPSNPRYDEKSAGEAGKLAVDFLRKRLR
jgi:carboxymethylenebutenolidase